MGPEPSWTSTPRGPAAEQVRHAGHGRLLNLQVGVEALDVRAVLHAPSRDGVYRDDELSEVDSHLTHL